MTFRNEDYQLNYYYLRKKIGSFVILDGDYDISSGLKRHISTGELIMALTYVQYYMSYSTLHIDNIENEKEIVSLITQQAAIVYGELSTMGDAIATNDVMCGILKRYVEGLVFYVHQNIPTPQPIKSAWINHNESGSTTYINTPLGEGILPFKNKYELHGFIGLLFSANMTSFREVGNFLIELEVFSNKVFKYNSTKGIIQASFQPKFQTSEKAKESNLKNFLEAFLQKYILPYELYYDEAYNPSHKISFEMAEIVKSTISTFPQTKLDFKPNELCFKLLDTVENDNCDFKKELGLIHFLIQEFLNS